MHEQRRNGGKSTHNQSRLLHIAGKFSVLRQEAVSWMDHVHIVLKGDLDDLVTSEIGTDWSILSALANDIGLVSLLPVHTEPVFIAVYGDGVERKLVSGTDYDILAGA
jgi:hypothetical protein